LWRTWAIDAVAKEYNMKKLDVLAVILLIIGGLNWGLVGLFRIDLVAAIFGMKFGEKSIFSAAVYVLVGLAALYLAVAWKIIQRRWDYEALTTHAH
jgi:uncharacterized protein